jgi:protease-4
MKSVLKTLRRMFVLFWHGVSAVRRFVVNLVFLLVVILVLSIFLFSGGNQVPDGAALILSPSGNIVEQKTARMLSNQMFGDAVQAETLLKDIIDVIDYARDDHRIKAMLLDLRDMGGAGPSKLQDIGAALVRFRDSGKRIMAYGDYFSQSQYYLAAHADNMPTMSTLIPWGGWDFTDTGCIAPILKVLWKSCVSIFMCFASVPTNPLLNRFYAMICQNTPGNPICPG